MDCSFVRNNLFAFHEKSLSRKEEEEFIGHVGSCRDCSLIWEEFQAIAGIMDLKKAEEPSPFAETRILQRIESQFDQRKVAVNPWYARVLQPLAATFILLVALLIGLSIGKKGIEKVPESTLHPDEIRSLRADLNIPVLTEEETLFNPGN